MRSLIFLPFTFLAGAHGFAIFAPYLAIVFAALHLRHRRRVQLARHSIASPSVSPSPLEPLAALSAA